MFSQAAISSLSDSEAEENGGIRPSMREKCIQDVDEDISDEEFDGEGAGGEEREVVKMQSPKLPPKDEVDNHMLTHVPFRSWCRHCVRARKR